MKAKDIIIVILISVILLGVSFLVFSYKSISDIKKENETCSTELLKSSTELLECSSTIEQLKTEREENNDTCSYIQTYRFIEDYNFDGPTPTIKFIVVDKFQAYEPKILKYDSNNFNISLEKDKYYEITFKSTYLDGKIFSTVIEKIEPSDKLGFDQIQESCY